jgi:hypothetical protein
MCSRVDSTLLDSWKPREWVNPSEVRPVMPAFDRASFDPAPGQKIEALTRGGENEPYGWWEATVRVMRQSFYLINYTGYDENFNEIVEKDTFRPVNPKPVFQAENLTLLAIPMPAELKEWALHHADSAFAQIEQVGTVSVPLFSVTVLILTC